MAMFLTGLGFAPVGLVPLPVYTALAWFLLQTPDGRETRDRRPARPADSRVAADLVRAFLTTDDAAAR